MQCIICGESADFYFSKSYAKTPFKELLPEEVNYYKCSNCGFVLSKTHADFTKERWGELNEAFHHWIEQPENNLEGNQPPYAEQALMLSLLGKNNIIKIDNMLDYAAGYGSLSRIADKYFGIDLPIYDPFVRASDGRYVVTEDLQTYSAVINSAMFEHITSREDLEGVK